MTTPRLPKPCPSPCSIANVSGIRVSEFGSIRIPAPPKPPKAPKAPAVDGAHLGGLERRIEEQAGEIAALVKVVFILDKRLDDLIAA